MIVKAKSCHIFSDVDGTLLAGWEPPQVNMDAVARFIQAGGKFSLATGRSIALAKKIALQIGANAPCILLDGAVIYDFSQEELIDYTPLPAGMVGFVKAIIAQFSKVAISVSTAFDAYEA